MNHSSDLSFHIADFEIVYGASVHKCHQAIILPQCRFFRDALQFGGRETDECRVELADDDPTMVALMLQFLYTADYTINFEGTAYLTALEYKIPNPPPPPMKVRSSAEAKITSLLMPLYVPARQYACQNKLILPNFLSKRHADTPPTPTPVFAQMPTPTIYHQPMSASELVINAKMYTLAEKYAILPLKMLARDKFLVCLQLFWREELLFSAIEEIWIGTPAGDTELRTMVVELVTTKIGLLEMEEMKRVMAAFPGLSYQVLVRRGEMER